MWTEPCLQAPASGGFALYLHAPFCRRKCPYCDFYSETICDRDVMSRYAQALYREMNARAKDYAGLTLQSIYLGGGTPSLLPVELVQGILARIRDSFDLAHDLEITLEVNPGTVKQEELLGLRRAGVNRLSVGVQSFDNKVLRFLGRIHNAETARRVLHEAREVGFSNLSIDLMIGAAEQTGVSFERDLDEIAELSPEHASVYMLTIEDDTPFGERLCSGDDPAIDDDSLAERYELLQQRLPELGLHQYEISNFAQRGRHSRHNLAYWKGTPYLGLGPAAHSFRLSRSGKGARREANPADLQSYLLWDFKTEAFHLSEAIDEETLRKELIFCGLRTCWGLDFADFEARTGQDLRRSHAQPLQRLAKLELVTLTDSKVCPTIRGFRFADALALEFF